MSFFYISLLNRKEAGAYSQLYQCLKEEKEHLGHRDLAKIIREEIGSFRQDVAESDVQIVDHHDKPVADMVKHNLLDHWSYVDMDLLSPLLYRAGLLSWSDWEDMQEFRGKEEKVKFLGTLLSRIEGGAYKLFKCLMEETEHVGHQHLVTIIQSQIPMLAESFGQPNSSSLVSHEDLHNNHIADIVQRNLAEFIQNTDMEQLSVFLLNDGILSVEDCEYLHSMTDNKAKSSFFYNLLLKTKGVRAYRKLYECLKEEEEHPGHL